MSPRSSLRNSLLVSLAIGAVCTALAPLVADADGAGLPEIAGIRPGMTEQQAYDILKARAGTAQIGIGEYPIDGVTQKPVPQAMSIGIANKVSAVTIKVWLTTPPSKPVVWAVGETIKYPDSQKLLTSAVFSSLRKKYGKETDSQPLFLHWVLDEQGRHATGRLHTCFFSGGDVSLQIDHHPGNYQYVSPVVGSVNQVYPCDSVVDFRAELHYANSDAHFTDAIKLLEIDRAAMTRTMLAYKAYVAQQNAREEKKELKKAGQQKAPQF